MVGGQPFAVNRSRQGPRPRGGLAASGRPYLPTYIEYVHHSKGPHRLEIRKDHNIIFLPLKDLISNKEEITVAIISRTLWKIYISISI